MVPPNYSFFQYCSLYIFIALNLLCSIFGIIYLLLFSILLSNYIALSGDSIKIFFTFAIAYNYMERNKEKRQLRDLQKLRATKLEER